MDEKLSSVGQPSIGVSSADDRHVQIVTPDEGEHFKGTGWFRSVWQIVCAIAGVGILGLPFSLSQTGWGGVALLVFLGILSLYTGYILAQCFIARSDLETFSDLGRETYGKVGVVLVNIAQIGTCVGACILFLVLSADNLQKVFAGWNAPMPLYFWTFISAALVLPLCFLKSLHEVSWVGIIGALTTFVGAILVVILALATPGPVTNHEYPTGSFTQFLTAFATMTFAYGGHVIFPNIMRVMRKPKDFRKSLYVAMPVIVAFYLLVAAVAYYQYGKLTSQNVLNNLPNNAGTIIVRLAMTGHVLMAYVLYLHPFFYILESAVGILRPQQAVTRRKDVFYSFSHLSDRTTPLSRTVSVDQGVRRLEEEEKSDRRSKARRGSKYPQADTTASQELSPGDDTVGSISAPHLPMKEMKKEESAESAIERRTRSMHPNAKAGADKKETEEEGADVPKEVTESKDLSEQEGSETEESQEKKLNASEGDQQEEKETDEDQETAKKTRWQRMKGKLSAKALRIILRSLTVAFTILVAIFVPFFAYLMAFVGATTQSLAIFVLPAAMHAKVFYKRVPLYLIVLDVVIVVFGVLAGGTGAVLAVIDIVHNAKDFKFFS